MYILLTLLIVSIAINVVSGIFINNKVNDISNFLDRYYSAQIIDEAISIDLQGRIK